MSDPATPDQGSAELSDEQIVSIYNASCNHLGSPDFITFARAILATATQGAPREPLPAETAQPMFASHVGRRKWESLQSDGYRMQRISFARSVDGHERRGTIDPWGKVLWDHAAAELVAAQGAPTPAQGEPAIVFDFDTEQAVAINVRMIGRVPLYLATTGKTGESDKPRLICPRCKVDRFQAACPGPLHACPMKAEAQTGESAASPSPSNERKDS